MSVGQLVASGPLLLAFPVAAAAGAVSFLSPCCLPLVPGYLSYVTGMAGAEAGPRPSDGPAPDGSPGPGGGEGAGVAVATRPVAVAPAPVPPPRGRVVAGTALFVLGFSLVFVAYGAVIGGLGHLMTSHADEFTRILGGLTIILGLMFAGVFDRFAFAGRMFRPSARPKAGLAGAPLLGMMFGFGWAPCTGPTLAAVLALSASSGTAGRGSVLAFVYALGLGIPFLLMSLGLQTGMRVVGFARRHARRITQVGGAMLVCVGVLEVSGLWLTFIATLQTHWSGYTVPL